MTRAELLDHFRRHRDAAESLAKGTALAAITGAADMRAANEEQAKLWNARAEAWSEAYALAQKIRESEIVT